MIRRLQPTRALPVAAAIWLLCPAAQAGSQSVTVADVKAAFEYNFVKFTEWPDDVLAPGEPITMCVIGDRGTSAALERTVKGHAVGGHDIHVLALDVGDPARACNVVDPGRARDSARTQLLAGLQGTPVLTVADWPGFAREGGIVELYLENDRLRFIVNLGAAHRAHLKLSAQLLKLAKLVEDD